MPTLGLGDSALSTSRWRRLRVQRVQVVSRRASSWKGQRVSVSLDANHPGQTPQSEADSTSGSSSQLINAHIRLMHNHSEPLTETLSKTKGVTRLNTALGHRQRPLGRPLGRFLARSFSPAQAKPGCSRRIRIYRTVRASSDG